MPGGKGGNQACAAARLGGSVALAGQVGNDSHGEWLRRSLEETGVDARFVSTDEGVGTGVALITIAADGENHIVLAPGDSARGDLSRNSTSGGREGCDR